MRAELLGVRKILFHNYSALGVVSGVQNLTISMVEGHSLTEA